MEQDRVPETEEELPEDDEAEWDWLNDPNYVGSRHHY